MGDRLAIPSGIDFFLFFSRVLMIYMRGINTVDYDDANYLQISGPSGSGGPALHAIYERNKWHASLPTALK